MWEFNGKLYARVSDVIKPYVDFSMIPEDVLNRKAALGTRVHKVIEEEIKGAFPVISHEESGYFQSFEKWRHALSPIFIETERRYYCDERRITGCVDGIIELKGDKEAVLVDFKTSAQESPISWPMQAHLYHYLISLTGKKLADRVLFLKLDRYGYLPKVYQYPITENMMTKCFNAVDSFWDGINVANN